jgi:flavin-dependent dehydrogenase
VRVLDEQGEPQVLRARILVAADGSRGSFSRTVIPSERLQPYAIAIRAYAEGVEGLDGALSFFLERNLLPGYGWLFPSSRPGGPVNLGLGMKLSALRRRPEKLSELFAWFMGPGSRAWPHLKHARLVEGPAPFPLQVDFPRGRRRTGEVLLAGDAANLIDPLSGEGIAYALESGMAAGLASARALKSGRRLDLARYDATIWKELSLEFLAAYLLREVLVQPWGNGLLMRLLMRDEGLARGGMGVLANSVPATWLLGPRVWRRVLAPSRVWATMRAARPATG